VISGLGDEQDAGVDTTPICGGELGRTTHWLRKPPVSLPTATPKTVAVAIRSAAKMAVERVIRTQGPTIACPDRDLTGRDGN
jgi:hypothetical protein